MACKIGVAVAVAVVASILMLALLVPPGAAVDAGRLRKCNNAECARESRLATCKDGACDVSLGGPCVCQGCPPAFPVPPRPPPTGASAKDEPSRRLGDGGERDRNDGDGDHGVTSPAGRGG